MWIHVGVKYSVVFFPGRFQGWMDGESSQSVSTMVSK